MDDAAFTALENEVSKLRAELAALRGFIKIDDAGGQRPPLMSIRCHSLELEDPKGEDEVVAQLAADSRGGRLMLWGRGDDAVAEVGVGASGAGEIVLFDRTPHRRVELGVDDKGHSYSVVFRTDGNPGALMKALGDSAAIGATGPDGRVRAGLMANAQGFRRGGPRHQRQSIASQSREQEEGGYRLERPRPGGSAALGVTADGPSLMLFHGWKAPAHRSHGSRSVRST